MMKDNQSHIIEESRNFEAIVNCQKDWMGKKAWRVTYCALALSFILSIVIVFLVLKYDKEIVLVRVDNNTGYAEVMTSSTEENLGADEALGKFFASRYVTLREQYVYGSLQDDYRLVQLYSGDNEQKEYISFFEQADSPDQIYGQDQTVKIEIISISISSGAEDFKIATIRFKKNIVDLKNFKSKEEHYTARVVYDFTPEVKITNKNRLDNPLGFKVSNYQVTAELK